MKVIEKKSVVPLPQATGSISDTINVDDKIHNAPSINLVQQMTGIPQDGVIAFDGDEIPEGYEEVENTNDTYSTEEQVIGTWINGKPIYRKVISVNKSIFGNGSATAGAGKTVAHGISNLDIGLDARFIWQRADGSKRVSPSCYFDSTSWSGQIYYKGTDMYFELGKDALNAMCQATYIYIILEYTKTTD